MQSIGYCPDCGTCNYLISSLCAVDKLAEAVKVLKGMGGAGCVPDLESYGIVIRAMCRVRKTADAAEMLKQMVVRMGLTPRQETVVKVAAALQANKEIWKQLRWLNSWRERVALLALKAMSWSLRVAWSVVSIIWQERWRWG